PSLFILDIFCADRHLVPVSSIFFLLLLHPPRSTLFPYTTLFRSYFASKIFAFHLQLYLFSQHFARFFYAICAHIITNPINTIAYMICRYCENIIKLPLFL